MYPEICTVSTRVAEYFEILANCDLWPTNNTFGSYSVAKLAAKIGSIEHSIRHSCGGGLDCPLKMELRILTGEVAQVVEGVSGLGLQSHVNDAEPHEDSRSENAEDA